MKKYKEHRKISADDIRSLCITMHWYTSGTNDDYSKLLEKVGSSENKELTTELIAEYAEDIIAHTANLDQEKNMTAVMFNIAMRSITTFEECGE